MARRLESAALVDFVGGADGYFYALNALTGAIIWKTLLGPPPGYYKLEFASPLPWEHLCGCGIPW